MNKNGNSNIIFIILIPIFIIFALVIVDTIISYNEVKRFKKITENIITQVMENDKLDYEDYYKEIKRLYELNNYETDMLVVNASEYRVTLDNEHRYFGLYSALTNKSAEDTYISILGVEFKVKKGSKTSLSIEARYNYEDELEFKYVE